MITHAIYPDNDEAFEEVGVVSVEAYKDGSYGIERADGFHFFVPSTTPVAPQAGMLARFYGHGIGGPVRGLFLDGHRVFYRTEAEDHEHNEIARYGRDAADWLARWDRDEGVWSIEMGGLGPGYEQAIQITAAEVLRIMLAKKFDATRWDDQSSWREDLASIEKDAHPVVDPLGLSGAQWGAAVNLASQIYRRGPRAVMNDERVNDRRIQVSRRLPSLEARTAA